MTYFPRGLPDDSWVDLAREAKANAVMLIRTVADDSEDSVYAATDRLTPQELALTAIALAGFLDGLASLITTDRDAWHQLLTVYMLHEKDDKDE